MAVALAFAACEGTGVAAQPVAVREVPVSLPGKATAVAQADARTVLVRLRPGTSEGEAAAVVRHAGGTLGARVGRTRYRRVRVPAGSRARALAGDPRIADVEPNRLRRAAAEPDDPWLSKTGRQDQLRALRLPEAWERSRGASSVRIAVVDSGVDLDMPDLAERLLPGRDLVDGDDRPQDENGHGTMMAGVAAAATDNGEGIAGAAWQASVIPVRVLDASGAGYDDDIAAGITWAADAGADVVLVALGAPGDSGVLRDAVAYATDAGAVVVAAAGNEGSERAQYPAAIPEVVAVSATDTSGVFAWFSSRGPWVDVAAPGLDVLATDRSDGPVGAYAAGDGTSFSSALVAGVAALVRAQHPAWTASRVAERLRETAQDRGPPGPDVFYGAGGIDAAAALGAAAPAPSAAFPTAAETGDTMDDALVVPFNSSREARFEVEGDVDWYAFDVAAPGWVSVGGNQITAFRGDRAEETDLAIELYDAAGRMVDQADEQGLGEDVEEIKFHADSPGRFYVRAWNAAGSRADYDIGFSATGANVTDTQFATSQGYPTISRAQFVAIGDVTGDGRADMIAGTQTRPEASALDFQLHVFEQDEDGWLRPAVRIPTRRALTGEGWLWSIAPGDLDGDGRTDVAAAVGTGVELHLQREGGLKEVVYVPARGANHVDVVDIDGNGEQDIVAGLVARGVAVISRTGSGWSRRRVAAREYREIEVGDVSGDARPDLVGIGRGVIDVMVQRPDASFEAPQEYSLGPDSWGIDGVEVADVTGDGRADVMAVEPFAARLHVLPQTVAGTLGVARSYPVDADTVEAADMNGDGRTDVVAMGGGYGAVVVAYQQPDGSLGPPHRYRFPWNPVHYTPDGLALGDLTGDGASDIAVADHNAGAVVVRRLGRGWPRRPLWVAGTTPAPRARGVAPTAVPTVRFARPLDPATVPGGVRLLGGPLAIEVPGTASYAGGRVSFRPSAPLTAGAYVLEVDGIRDAQGHPLRDPYRLHFRVGTVTDTTPPDTRISGGPDGHWPSPDGFMRMWATEATTRFECRVDAGAWEPCAPPRAHMFPDGYGPHSFQVRAIDAVGLADPTPAARTVITDDGRPSPPNDATVNAVRLTGENGSVAASNDNGHREPSLEPEHGGNAGGASLWWSWTAPRRGVVTFTTERSSFDTLLGVYTGSLEDANRLVRVAGDDDGGGERTSAVTFTARAGETYHVAVDGFNDGYDVDTGAVRLSWSLGEAPADTTAPETTIIDGPPALTNAGTARLEFVSSEPSGRFECRLNGWEWQSCWTGVEYLLGGDGRLVFEVRAIDAAENPDPTPARHEWEVDPWTPETTLVRGPASVTADRNPVYEFTSPDAGARFECWIDGGPWRPCTSPHRFGPVADGMHDVLIRAVDPAGNPDVSPAESTFSVEGAIPPLETTITAGPDDPWGADQATFAFTATRGDGFQCRLDAGPWTSCESPHTLHGLQTGTHTFAVRAVDGPEIDATPASRSFTVDVTPPETAIDEAPAEHVASTEATFRFSSEPGATFRCRLDGGPNTPCTSPVTYTGLSEGPHAFSVEAHDAFANRDPTPASRVWTVDVTAPETAVTAGPDDPSPERRAVIAFESEPGAQFECRLDDAGWQPCSSPTTYDALADGAHHVDVRGIDRAGNRDASPARHAWTIAGAPPDTVIDAGPPLLTASTEATLRFSSPGGASEFECRLDGGEWNPCSSPHSIVDVADGPHRAEVRAVDGDRRDPSPAVHEWSVDATPPDTRVDRGPEGAGTDRRPTFTFSSPDSDAAFQCRVDAGGWAACDSPHRLPELSLGAHRFAVRAVDRTGNVDASPAERAFTVTTAVRQGASSTPPVNAVDPPVDAVDPPADVVDPPADVTAPRLSRIRLSPNRITPRRARRGRVRLRVVASEPARLTLRIQRLVRGQPRKGRRIRRRLVTGVNRLRLPPRRLRAGRYRLRGRAVDAAGNRSALEPVRFTVRRRSPPR